MEQPKDKICHRCCGSGVMPKALIEPEPQDVKFMACTGTGKVIHLSTRQFYSGINAIGGHSGHGGGLD